MRYNARHFIRRAIVRSASRHLDIEFQEQAEVVRWLNTWNDARKLQGMPEIFFTASSNGGKVSMRQAVRFKILGYRAGTPDLVILEPRSNAHGLFIEMKRPAIPGVCDRGSVSKEQREFLSQATARRYAAHVCFGAAEAKMLIEKYLSGKAANN